MIKNNIEVDVKIKCIEAGKTQAQLGKQSEQLVSMLIVLSRSRMES